MKAIILFFFLFINTLFSQWIPVNDIPNNINIPSIFTESNTIYAGADNVIYTSTNGGNSWNKSSVIYSDADFVSSVIKHQNKIYAATYNYGVFVSSDEGNSWDEINNGLTGLGSKTITDLIVRGDSLYAATSGSGIFVMNISNPDTWHHFSNGLGWNISYNVFSLIMIDNILFAGAGGNGYYYTNEQGSDLWKEIKFGDLSSSQLVFYDIVKVESVYYLSSSYGIYKSTDYGLTWNPEILNYGFLENSNFVKAGSRVFAVLGKSVKSTWLEYDFSSQQWIWFDEQPVTLVLNTAAINDKLFSCTLNNLLFRELNATGIEEPGKIRDNFTLSQNYPNPFNPATTIEYSLKENANIKIEVYNSIGEMITLLVNKYHTAGYYKINFNAINLPSGNYFYRILYDNKLQLTKKMSYLK